MKIYTYESAIKWLKSNLNSHKPDSEDYFIMEESLKEIRDNELEKSNLQKTNFSFVGLRNNRIVFPYINMGSVTSVDLLRVDELIMFAYYDKYIDRYDVFFDLGANLGLHSLIVAPLGIKVIAYEPDPKHFLSLQRNVELNGLFNIDCRNAAIGTENSEVQFIRVLGNTTSSHTKGAKPNPYGKLEEFKVRCDELNSQLTPLKRSMLKIDIEGSEAKLVQSLSRANWEKVDAFVEVGSDENAELIFDYCHEIRLNIYTQKSGWNKISKSSDMPSDYRGGSIFLTNSNKMWG